MKKKKTTLSSSCVDGGGGTLVLRRGAWTQEEDNLLRQCIGKYGEGKWHLVPFRAGLKRCRKSCRLRWLNYLRPHIKRGDFGSDEVDLIVRLHNLLGNRWSLIAGRIPGRTANDVKNYWNTHLRKKLALPEAEPLCRDEDKLKQQKTTEISILRPRPTYARNLTSFIENNSSLDPNPRPNNTELATIFKCKPPAFPKNHQPSSFQLVDDHDDHIEAVQKVESLMFNDELKSSHEGASASASAWPFTGSEEKTLTDIWNDGLIMQMPLMDDGDFQEAQTGLGDFLVDHTMEDMGKYSFCL